MGNYRKVVRIEEAKQFWESYQQKNISQKQELIKHLAKNLIEIIPTINEKPEETVALILIQYFDDILETFNMKMDTINKQANIPIAS